MRQYVIKISLVEADSEDLEFLILRVAHEMAHIRQYRTKQKFNSPSFYGKRGRMRRIAHDRRPCEIDDEMRENRARDRRRQELAIELAIILEGTK